MYIIAIRTDAKCTISAMDRKPNGIDMWMMEPEIVLDSIYGKHESLINFMYDWDNQWEFISSKGKIALYVAKNETFRAD